jgi:predicted amidohydrolase
MQMTSLSVALWATNLEPPVASLQDWTARIEACMAKARAAGAGLLMLPEFACGQWLGFAPPGLALNQQVPWLASHVVAALDALRPLPQRYGMALLAGTMPYAPPGDDRHLNRAWLLLPDGRIYTQDKIFLTPSELNPNGWLLTPGSQINVIRWENLRIAIIVCLDIEATALWSRLATLDLDLILVPAKTDMLSGYYRVFGCAKARAIELQTVVCVVGAVGTFLGHPAADTVVGGAAAFVPCEATLGHTGIAASLEPHGAASGTSPLLCAFNLPVDYCRRIRHGEAAEAEVWPGSWKADHISVADPASAYSG